MDQFRKVLQPLSLNSPSFNSSSLENYTEDIDLAIQKEYLQKLKSQREKVNTHAIQTQKLYADYVQMLKEKDSLKNQLKSIQKIHKESQYRLINQIAQKDKILELLEEQVNTLRGQISILLKDRTKSLHQIQAYYQSSIDQMKNEIDILKRFEVQKNNKINELEHQLQVKNDQKNSLQVKLNKLEKQLEETNIIKNRQILQWQSKITSFNDYEKKYKQQQHKSTLLLDKVKGQLQFKNQQYESIKKLYQNLKQNQKSQLKQINQLKQKLINHKNNSDLVIKVKQLQSANDKIRSTSKKQNQSLKNTYQSKIQNQQIIIQKLKKQLASQKQQSNNYKLSFDEEKVLFEAIIEKLRNQVQKLTKQVQEGRQLIRITDKIRQQNGSLIQFIKKRQILQKQRRIIHQYQFNEIDKLENMLKNVK